MHAPPIAFLGLVERFGNHVDSRGALWKQDMLGLHSSLVSPIYPQSTDGLTFVFAIYNVRLGISARIRFVHENGSEAGQFQITARTETISGEVIAAAEHEPEASVALPVPPAAWTVFPVQFAITIPQPGCYTVLAEIDTDEEVPIGHVNFGALEPVPLTPDRIAAIKSDPLASQAVQATLGCGECKDGLWFYAALERDPALEARGCIWHADLSDRFRCGCGILDLDLTQYRKNLPSLLGTPVSLAARTSFVPLYEASSLHRLASHFSQLIAKQPREEALQLFIEENTLILHPFSPQRIFPKAPILTQYVTDFAIVNHQQELILVELEKPSTKLMKKDGGVHSELQHAFDQVRDWLHMVDEHRTAALECIGLDRKDVGAILGVVIAGRDAAYSPEHLRKLKAIDHGRIRFLTYDDLLASLSTLSRTFQNL